jgi:hypothetical protein
MSVDKIMTDVMHWVLLHLPYISPFWGYLAEGIGIIALVSLISWYFPALRSFAGAVVLAVVMGLFGYRKGELDERHHEER